MKAALFVFCFDCCFCVFASDGDPRSLFERSCHLSFEPSLYSAHFISCVVSTRAMSPHAFATAQFLARSSVMPGS